MREAEEAILNVPVNSFYECQKLEEMGAIELHA